MGIQETVHQLTELVERLTDLVDRLEKRTDKLEDHLKLGPAAGTICNSDECFPDEDRTNYFIRHDHTHGPECSVDCPCELGVPVGDFTGGAYPIAGSPNPTVAHSGLGARFVNVSHTLERMERIAERLEQPMKDTEQRAAAAEQWVRDNFPPTELDTSPRPMKDWQLRVMDSLPPTEFDTSVGEIDRET